jgi:AbrB family looped-hinge helix DNA binding protein
MMKGTCSKMRIVYGMVTVSDKGQIAIPVDLRNDLDLEKGDKLMVLKRKDEAGFTLLKIDKMDDLMHKLQEDGEFFKKDKE